RAAGGEIPGCVVGHRTFEAKQPGVEIGDDQEEWLGRLGLGHSARIASNITHDKGRYHAWCQNGERSSRNKVVVGLYEGFRVNSHHNYLFRIAPARTSRHRSTGPTVHGKPSPPHATYRRRSQRVERAHRPPIRPEDPTSRPTNAGTTDAR